MKNTQEILLQENGFTVSVIYNYEEEKGYYAETGNPYTWVEGTMEVDIRWVYFSFMDKITKIKGSELTKTQQDFIISKLQYE